MSKTSYGGLADERTPLTKTQIPPPDYVFMTNPNRLYRKQVHQFQCCICAVVLTIFAIALAITILYSVDKDIIDLPDMPADNASLQVLLGKSWPLPDDKVPEWNVDSLVSEKVEKAITAGKAKLEERDQLESVNPGLPVDSPSYRHQVSIKTSARATNLARSAYVMEAATKALVRGNQPKLKPVGRGPVLSADWLPSEECGAGVLPACAPSPYRSVDGSCNNEYKPSQWGVSMRSYRRQLAPDYADGVSTPRAASDGGLLPSARSVSVTVHRPAYRDDPKFTVMLAVWGQFMDHDVTATALSLGGGSKPLSCCRNTSVPAHPECFPVRLDAEDPYYKQFGVTCMEFVRSAPAPTCSLGPREQLNQVSSYLDGSVVYGNTAELSRALRTFQGGRLKMLTTADGRQLLPVSTRLDDGCNREAESAKGRYCFMTGDTRANENTHLTSLHLLMARQHNLVANQMQQLNPDWNDETVYQESRKVVAAQMQHITYNEFLPVLLGPDMMSELDLSPREEGYYEDYDAKVDATVSNNFATSAFRFAHTLLPALMKTVAENWESEDSVEMHKMLFDPYKLYETGALDKLVRGAIDTHLERADSYFNKQVTQHLFQAAAGEDEPMPSYGLDLVSLNVQRGRDHGLPAYPAWRRHCGLSVPSTFDDLQGVMDQGSLDRIKQTYRSVDDVDMYTGALSEFPVEGGLVGPTVTCLVSDQFKRMKQGDRYWYETGKLPQAFSADQLDEVRKTSLAAIICDTSDDVTTVQPQVMKSVGPDNVRAPCSQLPRPDLTKWAQPANGMKKSAAGAKYTKVGVTVTGGSVRTDSGEVLWDGTLPAELQLPLFSAPKLASPGTSAAVGHGVQWRGTVASDGTELQVTGEFSYPVFAHGPIPLGTNYSAKWVNGQFALSFAVTSDADVAYLSFPGSYESPIYFKEDKPSGKYPKKKFVLGTAEDLPTVIGDETLPLILIGSQSPDKTLFVWSGNGSITIPSATPQLVSLKDEGDKKDKSSLTGFFNVIGGNVKLESADGSTATVWSGDIPAAIPIPLPFKVQTTADSGEKFTVFGNGLEWSASITGSILEGSFAMPQYDRSVGAVSVNWLKGQFSLEVFPMMNTPLEQVLTPGVKYTSRVLLREELTPGVLKVNSIFDDINAPGSLESLVVESQQVIDALVPAPIILYGSMSPDKTVFYFSGKLILAVKPTEPKIEKQMKALDGPELASPPWATPKFGGSVNSGHVSVGLNGATPSTIWSGSVPVAIPAPTFFSPVYDEVGGKSFIFGNGIIWSGAVNGLSIKGTFSLPQSIWSLSGTTQQTWSGDFSFEINPLWNTTLTSIFVPGAKYYSKIHFQGAKYEPGMTSLNGVPGEDPTVTMAAPIILQGTYSLDKKTFYWSGSFIIAFQNKPALTFTIPKKPPVKNDVTKRSSIELDIISGSISAGFTGTDPKEIWAGGFPVTIPYSSLISRDSWDPVPSPDVMWSGEVDDGLFKGTFAVPTYLENVTAEVVQWWAGSFSFKYTPKYGKLLEDYVKPGKKYNFQVIFGQLQKSSNPNEGNGKTLQLVKFTQEAQVALEDAKVGKLIIRGNYFSKPFYCHIVPFCTEKKEYYWSGSAILTFPSPPKNKTDNLLKSAAKYDKVSGPFSSQFGGKVTSGSVTGGLVGASLNSWWSGSLPVNIPTSIFFTNKTKASPVLMGGRAIEWSGAIVGNILKGTFSFPQLVMDFPAPRVQNWTGQFSFAIEPLWNTSIDGLINPGVIYTSGLHFQGVKSGSGSEGGKQFVREADASGMQSAPLILQGTLSPDGSSFLWSGSFILSVKQKPVMLTLTAKKPTNTLQDDASPSSPIKPPPKPVKPKTTVSFTVITGQLMATNGSNTTETLWSGEMPININKDMFNPTNTLGAGASITWIPTSTSDPELSGSFSVMVYIKKGQTIQPVSWSGNFSMHYLTKWGGTFDGLVKSGKPYTCSIVFKEPAVKSSLDDALEDVPKKFVLQAGAPAGTPCTLVLTGKSYTKGGSPSICKIVPFMCSNTPPTNYYSFTGDGLLVVKPPENLIFPTPGTPRPLSVQSVMPRRVNTTVVSGSIVAGPESEFPKTLWSGNFPVNITLPVFWNSEDKSSDGKVPPGDVHAHGVIWSGSQMGPRVQGSLSIPQYSKAGVKWWSGRFSFLFKTSWGAIGDLDGLVVPRINYNSRIVFRDVHSPTPLLTPSQFDVDTATNAPIILLGTYAPNRKSFSWSGDVIIEVRDTPWNPSANLQLSSGKESMKESAPSVGGPFGPYGPYGPGGFGPYGPYGPGADSNNAPVGPWGPWGPGVWPMKPKQRVGVVVSAGGLTKNTDIGSIDWWSGIVPVTFPVNEYNLTEGINVIWTADTLSPKFTGSYSIAQLSDTADGKYAVKWTDGKFTFDVMPVWFTTMNAIEVGKQYATIVSSNSTKPSKEDVVAKYSTLMDFLMQTAGLEDSQVGSVNLKGTFSPDNQFFTWISEAWFSPNKTKAEKPKKLLLKAGVLRANQFGGSVYDGSVSTGSTGFFSFSHSVWSGSLPATIPFSTFWSGAMMESKFTKGVTWSASSVTDTYLAGTYSVPQYTWDGITTTVKWYSGKFKFYMKPLWNTTLSSIIQPGIQYYSKISFQGEKIPKLEGKAESDIPGTRLPIILQGTYSPDKTSFFWSGNFIIDGKKADKPLLGGAFGPFGPYGPYGPLSPNGPSENGTVGPTGPWGPWGPGLWPAKPKQRVGVVVSAGSLSKSNIIGTTDWWTGKIPVTFPVNEYNLTEGINVIWTADTLVPKFTGSYSIAHLSDTADGKYAVKWTDGKFSFDVMPVWFTTMNVIEVGKQYATIVSSNMTKPSKEDTAAKYSTLMEFLMETAGLEDSQIGSINLKGTFSLDKQYFTWLGEAWFYPNKTKADKSKKLLLQAGELRANQFGGLVTSGVISKESDSFFSFSKNIWTGDLPATIPFSELWSRSFIEGTKFTRGISWTAGSVSDTYLSGTYSVPQYTWNGIMTTVTWYKGDFKFNLKPLWNSSLSSIIQPGTQYYSRISFQGEKLPKLETKEASIIPGVRLPVILQGTYSVDRTTFFWTGNFIVGTVKTPKPTLGAPFGPVGPFGPYGPYGPSKPIGPFGPYGPYGPSNPIGPFGPYGPSKPIGPFGPYGPYGPYELAPSIWPMKPKQRVGVVISSGSLTKSADGSFVNWWSGSVPVTFPVEKFNISKGINVIWTAESLQPKFSGSYSIATILDGGAAFSVEWTDGTFTFDVMPLWFTTMDAIEVGKQYATIISSNSTKPSKADQVIMYDELTNLIMTSAGLEDSQVGSVNLKGSFSPDNTLFTWEGEAWFYPNKTSKVMPKQLLLNSGSLRASQFGGSVYDGTVSASTDSFFSFSRNIWTGNLPAVVPFSAFWSGSFIDGAKFTRGVTWTATSVTDSFFAGSYRVPQYTWNGLTTKVAWFKGNFKMYIRPLWNASLSTIVTPGIQYYSRINFQGGQTPLLIGKVDEVPGLDDLPGVRAPIILQGSYSPERDAFFWNGNFILDVKSGLQLGASEEEKPEKAMKPKERVGVLISAGSISKSNGGVSVPWWEGSVPVTFPTKEFDVSKGLHLVWTASTLYPKFSGKYSIAHFVNSGWMTAGTIEWLDGTFSFDVLPLWFTSLDVIELGKQYATVVTSNTTKFTKGEQEELYKTFLSEVEKAKGPASAQLGNINLKGSISPDNLYYTWEGEAWFYPNKSKIITPKVKLQSAVAKSASQFIGQVRSGSVTSGSSGFFSFFSSSLWSGSLPTEIPFDALWSGSFFEGVKYTKGISWIASQVTDSYIAGSYSVPQYSWNGLYKTVDWYQGEFKFDVQPEWNTTLTSLIQPGVQYYSRYSFQGEKLPLLEMMQSSDSDVPGNRISLVLMGSYTPMKTSFLWSGKFVLNAK